MSNPFIATTDRPSGLVLFNTKQPSNKARAKAAGLAFLNKVFGEARGKEIAKQGYFLVDDIDKAKEVKATMEAVQDMGVSQYVFNVTVWAKP